MIKKNVLEIVLLEQATIRFQAITSDTHYILDVFNNEELADVEYLRDCLNGSRDFPVFIFIAPDGSFRITNGGMTIKVDGEVKEGRKVLKKQHLLKELNSAISDIEHAKNILECLPEEHNIAVFGNQDAIDGIFNFLGTGKLGIGLIMALVRSFTTKNEGIIQLKEEDSDV